MKELLNDLLELFKSSDVKKFTETVNEKLKPFGVKFLSDIAVKKFDFSWNLNYQNISNQLHNEGQLKLLLEDDVKIHIDQGNINLKIRKDFVAQADQTGLPQISGLVVDILGPIDVPIKAITLVGEEIIVSGPGFSQHIPLPKL